MAQLASTNIFGTLAVSGNTFVGGYQIFDYGTNSNGSYIRYADGTMICWGMSSPGQALSANQIVSGVWYQFPAAFIATPNLACAGDSSTNGQPCYGYRYGTTATGSYLGVVGGPTSISFGVATFVAIGRWR